MSKARYQPGEPIHSLDELYQQKLIYWGNKIVPHGWACSWQIEFAAKYIKAGVITKAVLIEEAKREAAELSLNLAKSFDELMQ